MKEFSHHTSEHFSGEELDRGTDHLTDEQPYDILEVVITSCVNRYRNINGKFYVQWWKEAFWFLYAHCLSSSQTRSTIVILLRASQDGQ